MRMLPSKLWCTQRWVLVHFQMNCGAVRLICKRNWTRVQNQDVIL